MGWIGILELALVLIALLAALGVVAVRDRKVRRHFQILTDLAAVSETENSLEQTMAEICDALVPALADFCAIDLIEGGEARRAAVRAAAGAPEGTERLLAERPPSIPDRLCTEGGDAITVALKARGRVTGALTLGLGWSGRRYRGEDAHFAWILSGRVALALDNSGLFADLERAERARAKIGETLQRGLLPTPLPHIPGWSVAAMYRPAGAENEVGGDFYDAFKVPRGWMLVVGDVTGRGAQAASIAAVARYTLRTAAMLDDDPLVALRTLNRVLLARGDAALCSVAALTLGEDSFEPVRLAVAGHPPPLLVAGESVEEVATAGPVLGAFPDSHWRIARSEVEPGELLVIVTDGIAEAPAGGGRFGEARLRRELSGVDSPALAVRQLEAALLAYSDGPLVDDVAIVAIARASLAPGARLRAASSLDRVDG